MMTQIKALAVLAFAALAAASVDKPVISQGSDDTSPGNDANCPEQPYTITPYDAGMIPEDCANIAINYEHLNPADFENFYVSYGDCADPWVFCRHKDHVVSIDDLAKKFSKVPVGMRDYVKHVIGVPSEGAAYTMDGNIVFQGDYGLNGPFNGWLHETGHAMDGQGAFNGSPEGAWYSDSADWTATLAEDTNVPDEYSQTNPQEDIAQMVVLAVYDLINEGGLAPIRPNWFGIRYQLWRVKELAGDRLKPGGTCNRVVKPTGAMPVGGSVSRRTVLKPFALSVKETHDHSHGVESAPSNSRRHLLSSFVQSVKEKFGQGIPSEPSKSRRHLLSSFADSVREKFSLGVPSKPTEERRSLRPFTLSTKESHEHGSGQPHKH